MPGNTQTPQSEESREAAKVAVMKPHATRNPTSIYEPSGQNYGWGLSLLDGAPFYTWFDVPRMKRDPRVLFLAQMWQSPFQQVTWKVKATSPQVAEYVDRQFSRFWHNHLHAILDRYFWYGFGPGGVELIQRRGLVRLDQVRPIEPTDARPLVFTGGPDHKKLAGFQFGNTKVLAPHSFWFSGKSEFSKFYDRPPAAGMYEPWAEKRERNGAIAMRRTWFQMNSSRGKVLRHPTGRSDATDENPTGRDNQDIARQTLDYGQANSCYTLTNELHPGDNTKYAWELEFADSFPDRAGYRDYPKDLDEEMAEGAGIPTEVLEASATGSGFSGRMIPLMAWYGGVDVYTGLIIGSSDWLRYATAINYGPQAYYEIEPDSLVKKFLESAKGSSPGAAPSLPTQPPGGQSPGGGGQGPQGWSPYKGPHGGHGYQDPQNPKHIRYLSDGRYFDMDGRPFGSTVAVGSPIPRETRKRVRQILASKKKEAEFLTLSDDRGTPQHAAASGGMDPKTRRKQLMCLLAMLEFQRRAHAVNDPTSSQPYLDALAKHLRGAGSLELSWYGVQSARGHIKAVGEGEHAGKVLYGREAEAALRNQNRQPVSEAERPDHLRRLGAAQRAREILAKVAYGTHTPEDIAELHQHLPDLPYDKLVKSKDVLRDKYKALKGKFSDVRNLMDQVRDEVGVMPTKAAEEPKIAEAADAAPGAAPEDEKPTHAAVPTREDGTPATPQHGQVYQVPTGSLNVDPERFQFKLNTNAKGVTDVLKGSKTFDPFLGGTVTAWRDPETGKDFIVNGHHRHELADRTGHATMNVMYATDSKDAQAARAAGALVNMAEGRGTAIDAAKFLRDSGKTVADLAEKGISDKEPIVQQAAILLDLNDVAFAKLARGQLELPAALAVAKYVKDPDRQQKLFQRFADREEEGKDTSLRHMEMMAKAMASVPAIENQKKDLFSEFGGATHDDVFDEKTELAGFVGNHLAKELNDWTAVSNKGRADRVKDVGNVLKTDENQTLKEKAEQSKNLFDKLWSLGGPISDGLTEAAVELKKAKTKPEKDNARKHAVELARAGIQRELDTLNRKPGEAPQVDASPVGSGDGGRGEPAPDASPVQPEAAGGGASQEPVEAPKAEEPVAESPAPETPKESEFTSTEAKSLNAIAPGESAWVAGHFIRRTKDGQFQVETNKSYKTGSAEDAAGHIQQAWKDQAHDAKPVAAALDRAGKFAEPDWTDAAANDRIAAQKASVPDGARAVSLDENTKGRTGTVQVTADPENGKRTVKLVLDGGKETTATDFEPLDSKHSWRGEATSQPAEQPKEPAAKTPDMFGGAKAEPATPQEPDPKPDTYTSAGLPYREGGVLAEDKLDASHLPAIEKRIEALKESADAAREGAEKEPDAFAAGGRRQAAEEHDANRAVLEKAAEKLGGAKPQPETKKAKRAKKKDSALAGESSSMTNAPAAESKAVPEAAARFRTMLDSISKGTVTTPHIDALLSDFQKMSKSDLESLLTKLDLPGKPKTKGEAVTWLGTTLKMQHEMYAKGQTFEGNLPQSPNSASTTLDTPSVSRDTTPVEPQSAAREKESKMETATQVVPHETTAAEFHGLPVDSARESASASKFRGTNRDSASYQKLGPSKSVGVWAKKAEDAFGSPLGGGVPNEYLPKKPEGPRAVAEQIEQATAGANEVYRTDSPNDLTYAIMPNGALRQVSVGSPMSGKVGGAMRTLDNPSPDVLSAVRALGHYHAVKAAVDSGVAVRPEVRNAYPDLAAGAASQTKPAVMEGA